MTAIEKTIRIPDPSLVVLVGVSGSGKSTFARKHFRETEILSSDRFRAMIADNESNQTVTKEAFDLLHFVAARRLAFGNLTVIDATNVQVKSRRQLLSLALTHHVSSVALVFDLPVGKCLRRNMSRHDRRVASDVVHRQSEELHESLDSLESEGFQCVYFLSSEEEQDAAVVKRAPTR